MTAKFQQRSFCTRWWGIFVLNHNSRSKKQKPLEKDASWQGKNFSDYGSLGSMNQNTVRQTKSSLSLCRWLFKKNYNNTTLSGFHQHTLVKQLSISCLNKGTIEQPEFLVKTDQLSKIYTHTTTLQFSLQEYRFYSEPSNGVLLF